MNIVKKKCSNTFFSLKLFKYYFNNVIVILNIIIYNTHTLIDVIILFLFHVEKKKKSVKDRAH